MDPNQSGRKPGRTEQDLEEAKEEDSERGLSWFYVDVEGGFQHVGLQTFEVEEETLTAGFVESTASGGYVGGGFGLRLFVVTLGPRVRVGFFENWQLFSVGGELGLRIPIGRVEPAFSLGAGYSALGSFSGAVQGVNDSISIRGFDLRVAGMLDIFVTPVFSIGGGASWEFLGLTRPGVDLSSLSEQEQQDLEADEARRKVLEAEGSGYGSAVTITARLGLHF